MGFPLYLSIYSFGLLIYNCILIACFWSKQIFDVWMMNFCHCRLKLSLEAQFRQWHCRVSFQTELSILSVSSSSSQLLSFDRSRSLISGRWDFRSDTAMCSGAIGRQNRKSHYKVRFWYHCSILSLPSPTCQLLCIWADFLFRHVLTSWSVEVQLRMSL